MRLKAFLLLFMVISLRCVSQNGVEGEMNPIQELKKAEAMLVNPDSTLLMLAQLNKADLVDTQFIEFNRIKGIAFYRKGLLDSSLLYFSAAYELVDKQKCDPTLVSITNAMAVLLQRAGMLSNATEKYIEALNCAEEQGDSISKAKIYNNLSVVSNEVANYINAKKYATRSLKLYAILGEENRISGAMNSLGQAYLSVNEYDSAMHWFQESHSLKVKYGDHAGAALTINNIGLVHQRLGENEKALEYYLESARMRSEIGDVMGQASVLINLANLKTEMEAFQSASDYIKNAELLNESVRSPDLASRIHQAKALKSKAEGDFEMALNEMEAYRTIYDSIRSDKAMNSVANVQFEALLAKAKGKVGQYQREQQIKNEIITRQRIISLSLGIGLAIFIGLISLLLYQLKLLSGLRTALTNERDIAHRNAEARKEALNEVVHEIRTPIQAMISLTEFMEQEENVKEVKDLSKILHQSNLRLLNTINNVLSISRIEDGNYKLRMSDQSITTIVAEVVDGLEPSARAKGIQIVREWTEDDEVMHSTDRSVLDIILMNVIGNAIKYTDKGEIRVNVSRNDRGFITIRVEDTGVGIPKEHLEFIFDAFFQSHDQRRLGQVGSGLGLSIAKAHAELLKIDLSVESEVNRGTVFTITMNA